MTRNIFHIFIALALSHTLTSQILPNRYVDQIFVSVIETQGVQFSTAVPQPKVNWFHPYVFISGLPLVVFEDDFNNVNLEMDVFEPQGDTMEVRPLVIVAFGGGFVDDTRKDWDIRLLCEDLARRGYITASIDYRLGMNVLDEELSKRAVYRGVQDARSAVRFFKNDASNNNNFRVDTNQIFLGGHSSGGFIALHTAYIDKDSERPRSTKDSVDMTGQTVYKEMGCLDCVGNNPEYVGNVKAIFNLAGAIGDTLYMESSSDLPIISFHSEDDDTVPYDVGEPFDNVPLVSFNLPLVMGSSPIHRYADQLGIINEFYSYINLGHSIHHNGISLYPYIVPNISNFFYEHCLKPEVLSINGNHVFCTTDNTQNYLAIGGNPKYYDWEVTGGTILNPSIYSTSAEVSWDLSAPLHELKVTPYSSNGARGNQIIMPINVTSGNLVEWTTASGDWNDENNWNLNRMPLSCDDVLINSAVALDVMVLPGTTIEVQSLTLQGPINLDIAPSSLFKINND